MLKTLVLLLHLVPRYRADIITTPSFSSGPTLSNVYERMCYRGGQLETSIVPLPTKPDIKPSPKTSVGPTPPPHPPLTSRGEERREGWEAEKLQLGHKGWQEDPHHRASSSALCLVTELRHASWGNTGIQWKGAQRAGSYICVYVCFKAFIVGLLLPMYVRVINVYECVIMIAKINK